MNPRVVATIALVLALIGSVGTACADAPDPGDLGAFCSLLQNGVGLAAGANEAEYAQLALVAPPAIRPTIDSLQTQARDFDELLNVEPPDLAALFSARFDPEADRERAELDRYAADSCGMVVARPPITRWTNHVRENHAEAAWRNVAQAQFEVGLDGDQISAATMFFPETPAELALLEDVCRAVSQFLVAEGSVAAPVRVLIGESVMIDEPNPEGSCRLP